MKIFKLLGTSIFSDSESFYSLFFDARFKLQPDEPVDDGQEGTVVDNHDFCDVCGGDGELVCCDNCPNVYHKECHDPPLRNIPR